VRVAGRTLDTRFTLLCTGSRPAIPPIDGLERAGYLTTETLFELERPPDSLAVIGGGPVAVELAQACRRLGVAVTLLEQGATLLPREEPRLVRASCNGSSRTVSSSGPASTSRASTATGRASA